MALGIVRTSILTDIANAIRQQAGVSTLYRPREMAAAVAALDGTRAGTPGVEPYMQLEEGVLSSQVFDDIADAIRAQNGSQAEYLPGDMAAAILALSWDTGLKARALLLADGTLELNYRSGQSSDVGIIAQCWEVDVAGYASADARPWHASRDSVTRVVLDVDLANAGLAKLDFLFHSMGYLTEVTGLEALSGATSAIQTFSGCGRLETIYATGFDNMAIANASGVLNGCKRLVGGTGYVASSTAGRSALSLGASGVLTNPSADSRVWLRAHLYADGELQLTAAGDPDANRTLVCSGRMCANARYAAAGCSPWHESRSSLTSATFLADVAGVTLASLDHWFDGDSALSSVAGWANVRGLASVRHAFNGCVGLVTLSLAGLDPSALRDWYYAFGGCSSLVTIYADATWALPAGATGQYAFSGCTSLVGGAGTAYSAGATGCAMAVIDRAGQVGYFSEAM